MSEAEIVQAAPQDTKPALSPMSLLEIAVSQHADIAKIEKLMELQLRWEANEAKKAFVVAMNAFKAKPPEIIRNREVAFNQTAYKYATLDNVTDQITDGLSRHSISHRWKVEQLEGRIRVTCILTHEQGHSEETTIEGEPDKSGSKNSIQAIGSSISYLERYSLLAATGLAVQGDDTDSMPQLDGLNDMLKRIVSSENLTQLEQNYKEAFKKATAEQNFPAMKMVVEAKDQRKQELLKDEPAQ